MTIADLVNDKGFKDYILEFFKDPRFIHVKDAFVSHVPENGTEAHGKYLGTRFVFNELERIAKELPKIDKPKSEVVRKDPDLDDE